MLGYYASTFSYLGGSTIKFNKEMWIAVLYLVKFYTSLFKTFFSKLKDDNASRKVFFSQT